jgi:hypothetical protein
VGVFDPSDHVGFGLEAPDELGLGSQLTADLLDRDLTVDRGLNAAPDDRKRSCPDLFEQPIPAQGPPCVFDLQGGVA